MLSWILEEILPLSLPPSERKGIEIACEEALINIIEHAYKGSQGHIELSMQVSKDCIIIEISDKGPPFNPLLDKKDMDSSLPLEKREVGGLGIPIMKKYMDEVRYERKGNSNVLTLIKNY